MCCVSHYQGEPNDEALFKLVDKGGGLVSFESAALLPKSHQFYITVKKPNGSAGNAKVGLTFLSDESVFEVRVAQLVSTIVEMWVVLLLLIA